MHKLKSILPLLLLVSTSLHAQTPYDDFAPEVSRPILELGCLSDEPSIPSHDTTSYAMVIDMQHEQVLLIDAQGEVVAYAPMTDDIRKWLSVDPLADKYPEISPYAYCAWNPIKYTDPDGRSTKVLRNDDTYTVFGGDLNDGDLHIYEYTKDKDGNLIKGNSIGVSTSTTSFYNSDTKKWNGIINPKDMSGQIFLGEIFGNKISLTDYMQNARRGELFDFKYSNGTIDVSDDGQNMYRGMPFCKNQNGETVYSSARDMGNIAAGYIAGSNGISWGATRIAFDILQSKQDKRPSIEGKSSRYAQYLGWCMGYYNNSPAQQSRNILKSLKRW